MPGSSAGPESLYSRASKAALNVFVAEGQTLDDPRDLTEQTTAQEAFIHIEVWTSRLLLSDRGPKILIPLPRISVLTGCRVLARAHLYAHELHIVVALQELRSLRPTIGWPAIRAMRHPACNF
jgi:hypothetical protein